MADGILKRFRDIMSSNINALLDKAEDPEKMIDQYMRDIESDLGKVKAETAAVMAEETRNRRELNENTEQIAKMENYAKKALAGGNEADARKFVEKKQSLERTRVDLEKSLEIASQNADQMKQMHDKLIKDISSLESRKAEIKAKMNVAKAQEKVNQVGGSVKGVKGSMSAFDRMEDKANRMLDEANAMAELNRNADVEDMDALAAKYDDSDNAESESVDNELEKLKQELGL